MLPIRTALITGATGGLGEELCRTFARQGYQLVITARNKSALEAQARRLRRAYGAPVTVLAADFCATGAPLTLFNELGMMGIEVDVLVNNAGFSAGGDFVEITPEQQQEMMRVNMSAPTQLFRMLLPHMLSRGRGRILNVCSTGSIAPGPHNAVYCATKAYLLHLSEALSQEVRGTGVTVTAVCPGAIHTGFAHRAEMETTYLFRFGVMHPKAVAQAVYTAMMKGKHVEVVGTQNKALMFAARLAPRCTVARLSGWIQKPRGLFASEGFCEGFFNHTGVWMKAKRFRKKNGSV